jgi:Na+/phosphate symporter
MVDVLPTHLIIGEVYDIWYMLTIIFTAVSVVDLFARPKVMYDAIEANIKANHSKLASVTVVEGLGHYVSFLHTCNLFVTVTDMWQLPVVDPAQTAHIIFNMLCRQIREDTPKL